MVNLHKRLHNCYREMKKNLTIIVPSYNMEAYLPKCLGSLIVDDNELLQKLDVIVVNDGSKDRTSEIAHEFEARYPGVFRVIDKANGHYGSCINAGLAAAAGTFIKVLDADDYYLTDNFKDYLALVDAECKKGEMCADLILNDWEEDVGTGRPPYIVSFSYLTGRPCSIADIEFYGDHRFEMFAVAYRTAILRHIGYHQPEGITHTDKLWINLPMSQVHRIAVVDKIVYHYYVGRPGNTCNAEEYYRTYHVQMDMLMRMITQYNEVKTTLDEQAEVFFRNHLRYRAGRAYAVHLIERSPLLKKDALKTLDDFLRENARWLYEEMGERTISRKLAYHYIRDWRRKQRITFMMNIRFSVLVFTLHVYGRLRKLIHHACEHGIGFAFGKVKRQILRQGEYAKRKKENGK